MAKTGRKNIGSLTRWIPLTFSGKESWKHTHTHRHEQTLTQQAGQSIRDLNKTWKTKHATKIVALYSPDTERRINEDKCILFCALWI